MNRKGFASVAILLIVVGIIAIGGIWYYAARKSVSNVSDQNASSANPGANSTSTTISTTTSTISLADVSPVGSTIGGISLSKIISYSDTSSSSFIYATHNFSIMKSTVYLQGQGAPILNSVAIKEANAPSSTPSALTAEYDQDGGFELFGYGSNIILVAKRANAGMPLEYTIGVFNIETGRAWTLTNDWDVSDESYGSNSDDPDSRYPPPAGPDSRCSAFYCANYGPTSFIAESNGLYLKVRNDYCVYASNGSAVCRDGFYHIGSDGEMMEDDSPFLNEFEERVSWADEEILSLASTSPPIELRIPALVRAMNMSARDGQDAAVAWFTSLENKYHFLEADPPYTFLPSAAGLQQVLSPKPIASSSVYVTPTCSFLANPQSVGPAQDSQLSWSCINATGCEIRSNRGDDFLVQDTSGTIGVGPISTTTSYTLGCGDEYATTSTTVIVNFIPTSEFTSSSTVQVGDFTVVAYCKAISTDGLASVSEIDILKGSSTVQTITTTGIAPGGSDCPNPQSKDINADGYPDFMIVYNYGNEYTDYVYWLYNSSTDQFSCPNTNPNSGKPWLNCSIDEPD